MQAQATVAGRVPAAWERGVPCIDHKIDIASEAGCLGAVGILFFAILTVWWAVFLICQLEKNVNVLTKPKHKSKLRKRQVGAINRPHLP